jgi:hypothetical protein
MGRNPFFMTDRPMPYRVLLFIVLAMLAGFACNLTTEGNTPQQKRVTEERPAIVLLAPTASSDFEVGTQVTFHAMARDVGPGVARIEFRINVPGDPVTLVQNAPNANGQPTLEAIVTWQATGDQTYLVEAQAFRADGTPSNVEQTSISVVNPNPASNQTPSEGSSPPPGNQTQDNAQPLTLNLPEGGLAGTVVGDVVPIRQGPDTTYPTVTLLNQGDAIQIVGRSVDTLWYVIRVEGGFGWIIRASVQVNGDTSNLPVVEAPPQS